MAAGALSDYAENKLLDHVLGRAAFSMPSTVYAALYTAAPTDAGGGTQVSGGAYARQAFSVNATSGGTTKPTGDVQFPVATASWGTVVAVGIFDAASGGNLLMWATFAASKAIAAGDQLVIPANDLVFTLD